MAVKECWHCHDTDKCDCIFCGQETLTGFMAGKCGACIGRRETEAMNAMFPDANPLDKSNWKRVGNPRDQSPAHKVYIPREKYLAAVKK